MTEGAELEVRTTPRPDNPYTESLLALDIWDGLTITFSFPDDVSDYPDYDTDLADILAGFTSFNEMQKDAVRHILATISSFTNLVFVELTGSDDANATMRFGNTAITESAFAFLPSADSVGGDSWYGTATELKSPEVGNYGYLALLHEIGHALGLLHPFEPDVGPPLPNDRDWMPYTVMSYNSFEGSDGYFNAADGFAQTFMMEDIAALQHAYGTNYDTNSDDTLYFVDTDTGELYVNGVTERSPGTNTVLRTIWDGGGNDTYDFANYTGEHTGGLIIDLAPGGWIAITFQQRADLGGEHPPGEIANAHLVDGDLRSIIENARGSTKGVSSRAIRLLTGWMAIWVTMNSTGTLAMIT
ncbi:M10 family metallopeptidase [Erythrobacter alti]|uniref:M10 family metallopeptidase n=1 Tax=Erythrobacter alti TaxID=1896145 RepID=UPI0030F3F353